jgi:opacity protein-like surface antigen
MKTLRIRLIQGLAIVTLIATTSSNVKAQDSGGETRKKVEFGLRLMPTFSKFETHTSDGGIVGGSARMGFGAGMFFGINFNNHVGIQTELIYSSISQKSIDNNINRKIVLKYVNVPLLLSLNTNKSKVINLNIVGGPQIGFNAGSSITLEGANNDNSPQPLFSVKKNDFGFAYGAGLDFGLNASRTVRLGIGYRGVIGLIDISNRSKTEATDTYYVLERTLLKTNSAYAGLSIMF